ncbi:MAG TPA: hypothetical protein VKW08_00310 [Xanthobacteraceae bacterium]|jgi:hypothetical protein|nr:hypothetical protein [Xanthobacteraceae bacterium]
MADDPKEIIEYKTDHDLLIELRVLITEMRRDMREMKDGTSTTLGDHEKRIRSLEETRTAEQGRTGVFSWLGTFIYGILALGAGLIGSYIQAGKLP